MVEEAGDSYLLELTPNSTKSATEVFLNGKKLALLPATSGLTKLSLLAHNQIRIRSVGKAGASVRARIYSYRRQTNLFGPKVFTGTRQSSIIEESLRAPVAGQYLVKVGGKPLNLLFAALSVVRLNGIDLLRLKDLLTIRDGEIIKLVSLNQENTLSVRLFNKSSVTISVLKNPDSQEPTEFSTGELSFANANEAAAVNLNQELRLNLQNSDFLRSPGSVTVTLNGEELENVSASFPTSRSLRIQPFWIDGKNEIEISTLDSQNRLLSISGSFVAGDNELIVRLKDEEGQPVNEGEVVLKTNASSPLIVRAQAIDSVATFRNLPNGALELSGTSDLKLGSTIAVTYQSSSLDLILKSYSPPGADGSGLRAGRLASEPSVVPINVTVSPNMSKDVGSAADPNTGAEIDLIYFYGRYEQWIQVPSFARSITVKGRFNGPSGLQSTNPEAAFQGGFTIVTLNPNNGKLLQSGNKTPTSDGIAYSTQKVSEGVTQMLLVVDVYRYLNLPNQTITIESVSFSGAQLINSSLRNLRGEPLKYLSADSTNPYFNGNSILYGGFSIVCGTNDWVTDAYVEFGQGTTLRYAPMSVSARELLENAAQLQQSNLSVSNLNVFEAEPTFVLPNSQANFGSALTVSPTLVIKTNGGEEIRQSFEDVGVFRRYTRLNRYGSQQANGGPRDRAVGGDDWARPRIVNILNAISSRVETLESLNVTPKIQIGFKVNDFSSMHGGQFPPHTVGHRNGREVDAVVNGFANDGTAPGQLAAKNLLFLLGQLSPELKSNIRNILVTFPPEGPFATELDRAKSLQPMDVALIQNDQRTRSHRNHFHIGFKSIVGE